MSTENKLQSRTEALTILDEDTGKMIEITPAMRALALGLQQRLNATALITALILKKISDEKLYLALGCGSFKEYAEMMLPFSRQQAYKFIKIAETFAPVLGDYNLSVASMRHLDGKVEVADHEDLSELSSLGLVKLYELTKIEDADFTEVMSKGIVVLPDGREFDIEEIKQESARKAIEQLRQLRKEYSTKLSSTEEAKKKYRAERDHFKEQLERDRDKVERAYEMEAKFGKEANRISEIEYLLQLTRQHLVQAELYWGKLTIEDNDPEGLQEEARSIMRRLNVMQYLAIRRFSWFNELEEMQVLPTTMMKGVMNEFLEEVDPETGEILN